MPTYRNTYSYVEDGIGLVSMLFVMADTYNALFADEEDCVQTRVFTIGDSSKDLDIGAGMIAEDELDITCDESLAENAGDAEAIDFFLQAQDKTVMRFVATFMQVGGIPSVPAVAKAEFLGVLKPDMKGKVVQYTDAGLYASELNPLREWRATARSFGDAVVGDFTVQQLVEGLTEPVYDDDGVQTGTTHIIAPIGKHINGSGELEDDTWISTWVDNYISYYRWDGRSAMFLSMVNLNVVLQKLASQVAVGLMRRGVGEYTVNFQNCETDLKYSPARYNRFVQGSSENIRFLGSTRRFLDQPPSYTVWADDAQTLQLGTTTSLVSPFITWRLVKPQGKDEKEHSWYKYKSLADLLYGIAYSFGMFLRMYSTTANVLEVQFIPRRDIKQARVYIRGAITDDVDVKPAPAEKSERFATFATPYAIEGEDAYWFDNRPEDDAFNFNTQYGFNKSDKYNERKLAGNPLPLSVSPTIRDYNGSASDGDLQNIMISHLPHNTGLFNGSELPSFEDAPERSAPGLHTAIYMRTHILNERVDDEEAELMLPAARIHAKMYGVDRYWDTISDYLNEVTARDADWYLTERNIDVPFIFGFSNNADGSSSDWTKLKLGSEIILDGVSYITVGIKRNFAEQRTKIRLQNTARFSFDHAETIAGRSDGSPLVTPSNPATTRQRPRYLAGESLTAGMVVSIHDDNKVYHALAHNSDYNRIRGIVAKDTDADDWADIILPGECCANYTYEFTPGERLFVRNATSGFNLSHEWLTLAEVTEDEDMYVEIGQANSATSFILTEPYCHVYEVVS